MTDYVKSEQPPALSMNAYTSFMTDEGKPNHYLHTIFSTFFPQLNGQKPHTSWSFVMQHSRLDDDEDGFPSPPEISLWAARRKGAWS